MAWKKHQLCETTGHRGIVQFYILGQAWTCSVHVYKHSTIQVSRTYRAVFVPRNSWAPYPTSGASGRVPTIYLFFCRLC